MIDTPAMKKLRQEIGYTRKQIGIDEDLYREMLSERFNVFSCTQLTEIQLREFIKILKENGLKSGKFKPVKKYSFQKRKYEELGKREGMASPAQLRMIEAIWFEVSNQTSDEARADALNNFLDKHFGVSNIKWIESTMVGKIKKTLEKMLYQKQISS